MSRHPSPGPSALHQPPSVSSRQKQQKPYTIGITAGAEDVKYQTKYKELKRKVKDIEADNDKLHFKVLQAKRSIQRMKLERASRPSSILYERLSSQTPPPDAHDRHALQNMHHPGSTAPLYQQSLRGHPGNTQSREIRDHPPSADDHSLTDYLRTQGHARPAPNTDPRHGPTMEYSVGPAVAPSPHVLHSPRRSSNSHDNARQLPPLQQLPPIAMEMPRSHSHSQTHTSPSIHSSHITASKERSRSHSSSHSRGPPPQPYNMQGTNHQQQPYPDSRTPIQHPIQSPALSERERTRRHDVHEITEPHSLARHPTPISQLSPSLHSADTRSGRVHSHQRMGPGTYINREDQHQQDMERDREWDRSRELSRGRDYGSSHMPSPPLLHRSRSAIERGEHNDHQSSRVREESNYYHECPPPAGYTMLSRSDSPGSGSGSGDVPQRADSLPQHYEHERSRSYRLRPVNQSSKDVEYMHSEDGRSQALEQGGGNFTPQPAQEPSRPSTEGTRKRSRSDMDVDSEP
ncbi:hypothetical protein AMATHDRAFT_47191 [Amanita thiersii Skay4041]|uniref:INO80 complex subunit F domain-containing protein n=1 Tax=Amanita thiersii Skay4041 TaxID=703135 RepID=A0A2A9NUI1_9AGAR|nr:hypothetical protein AMATHDRAFT_47191 [Amanita thiersii Skay4041]